MKRVICAVGMATALLVAVPAMAQTAAAPAAAANGPAVNMWYLGGLAGIGTVQNVGALAGAEAGFRVYHNVDLIVEGGWAADAVTRRRTDLAGVVSSYLQAATGKTATSEVKAPTTYGLAGVRYVMDASNSLHPYLLGEVGRASVEFKPTFSLAGADVTSTLGTYGVVLGQDLVSTEAKMAFGAGVGLWYTKGQWYADLGVRLLSIQTSSQSTNMTRAHLGFGVRF